MRKLLSLEDLYNFYYTQNKNYNFNSQKTDSSICVHVDEEMLFSKEYNADEFKLKTHLRACHLFENRNHSSISEDAMKKAIPSFYNAPILGYIHKLENGEYDFAGHEMHISENGDVVYDEIPVGVIPESCNAQLKYDEQNDKTYLEVDGIIFKEYTKAAEILERKKNSKVSIEIAVDELSYSADTHILNIEEFHFLGITILGVTDDEREIPIEEGMYGSNITIEDFSIAKNSVCFNYQQNDKLIETLEKLNETLKDFNNTTKRKEEDNSMEGENFETIENTPEEVVEQEVSETIVNENPIDYSVNYSVNIGETKRDFSVSLNAKIYAMQELINETYADDGDYYCVEIFEDTGIVEAHGWFKDFRQEFKCKKDKYSLTGDRIDIFSKWMTTDEIAAFDRMKANYSIIEDKLNTVSEKLAKYEAEPQKMEILNSNDYAQINEVENFVELKNNHFDLTIDEVREKADAILLDYAKNNTLKDIQPISKKTYASAPKKAGRYGDLFSK